MKSRISFQSKLKKPSDPQVVQLDKEMPNAQGARTMVIPTPMMILGYVNQVPKGSVLTLSELRYRLAQDANADTACPLTTGLFLNIVAHATEEALASGNGLTAPYWRVVKDDGSLNPKFPGGEVSQLAHLQAENVPLVTARTKTRVHMPAATAHEL